jgi:hypothetical protein
MTETIGIVRGQTLYGMGDFMTASLAAILRARGYRTLDLDGFPLERDVAMLERANVAAILAYNAMIAAPGDDRGISHLDDARIPVIAWLVDHPIYHLSRLRSRSRLLVVASIDESHSRFLADWGVNGCNVELHHFAVGDLQPDRDVERDIDVLFPASLVDPDTLRNEWSKYPKALGSLIEQSTSEWLSSTDADLVGIIGALCERSGISDPEQIGRAVGSTFRHADQYVRARRRVDILNTLAEAGIVVDHVGNGDRAHPALQRHRAHGALRARDLPKWFRRARVVLNAGLNFPAGSHERVFSAQRQGAAVATEANAYWRRVLTDEADALIFSWSELDRLAARFKDVLQSPDRLLSIGCRGRHVAEDSIVRAGDEAVAAVQASGRLRDSTS